MCQPDSPVEDQARRFPLPAEDKGRKIVAVIGCDAGAFLADNQSSSDRLEIIKRWSVQGTTLLRITGTLPPMKMVRLTRLTQMARQITAAETKRACAIN